MKKRNYLLLNILMITSIILLLSFQTYALDTMTLKIMDKVYEEIPYVIEDGVLLAPARTVLEGLGGMINWYGSLKVLQVKFDEELEFKMQMGSPIIQKNSGPQRDNSGAQIEKVSVPPQIIEGQGMIPLSYFVKQLGFLIKWDKSKKVTTIFKPSNWVLDLTFDEGLNGESLVITSTKEVPYVTHVLGNPNRLVIDIKRSALSARASDILWESYVFKNVRISQYDLETVRIVIELNHEVQYKILEESGPDGFKVIVAFDPGIREVVMGKKGISIKSSGEIGEYTILELGERLVVDLTDQILQLSEKTINFDHPLIERVRASQFSWEPKKARLVLDLKKDIEYNVLRGDTAKEIIISTRDRSELDESNLINGDTSLANGSDSNSALSSDQSVDDSQQLNDKNETNRVTNFDEFIVLDIGNEYGDNEVVSIGLITGINQRIVIHTSTPMPYKAWYLPDPDRLVIDIEGAKIQQKTSQLPGEKGSVKKVRMHQYPDKVRVVFDLSEYVNHQTLSDERTQKIEIGLGHNPLAGKIIVLDPGHGGSDPGAIGKGGLFEKDITLKFGLKLKQLLKNAGATVIMTREKDVYPTLGERVDLANQLNSDIFVSIHCNSFAGVDPGGTETFISPTPTSQTILLAEKVQENLVKAIGLFDRGVKSDQFYVLNNTTMPAILVEVAFLSKDEEAELLKQDDFQFKAANGIYVGILAYLIKISESGDNQ